VRLLVPGEVTKMSVKSRTSELSMLQSHSAAVHSDFNHSPAFASPPNIPKSTPQPSPSPPPPPPPPPMLKIIPSSSDARSAPQKTQSSSPASNAEKTYYRIPITTDILKSVVLKPPGERKLKVTAL